MTHVMHDCKSEFAESIIESFKANHGWPHDKIPLTVDISRKTGESKHPTCPYCGQDTKDMEVVPAEDVLKLGVNLKASGAGKSPATQYKQQNAELAKELAEIRKALAAMKKGGKD